MRSLIRRAAVLAGAVAVVLGSGTVTATAAPQPHLAFTHPTFNYGALLFHTTKSETFTLANTGDSATGPVTTTLAGSAQFSIIPNPPGTTPGPCQGQSLGPGQECTVTVEFAPTTEGRSLALLTAASSEPAATARVALAGTGVVPRLAFDDSRLDFGRIDVGTHQEQAQVLQNDLASATGPLKVSLTGSPEFRIVPNLHGTTPCEGTNLEPGGRCVVEVEFSPTTAGKVTATLSAVGTQPDATATADLTGTGRAGNCSSASAAPANGTGKTPTGAHLYWADLNGGTICGANLNGTGVTTLVTGQDGPYGVAVDNSHIYWADSFNDTIMRANLNGTDVTVLVGGEFLAQGMAVDRHHIYWTRGSSGGPIRKANLNGASPTTLVPEQPHPVEVAVDSSHIYWTNTGNAFAPGSVMKANLNGTDETELVADQRGANGIAVDSSHIYWTNGSTGTIMRADLNGTDETELVTGQNGPAGVAVADGRIFWSSFESGTIMEADLNGKMVKTLVTGQDGPAGVAVGPQEVTPTPVPVTG